MIQTLVAIAVIFARAGLLAFGGGLSVLPEMERAVVGSQGWLTHREFVDSYALSQMTPGPGMLMVVMIGDRVAGLPGALVAGLAMFAPTGALSWFAANRWAKLSDVPWLTTVRSMLAPIALGLLAAGVQSLFHLAVNGAVTGALALASVIAIAWLKVSPMIVVACGAVIGLALLR